ncbi:MAG TPA: hypothetical protein VJ969_04500 [Desulfopila sp.]|nr:hypothetical protein [Desulfopila sp.]
MTMNPGGVSPATVLEEVVRGYDIIGDVAIVKIAEESRWDTKVVGWALQETYPHVRLVARRVGDCKGEFRLMPLQRIAGSGGFATLHKEYGLRLHVDPSRVYYSPRSGAERFRLAGLVGGKERVLVMFSGIAPLPLMIARYSDAAQIIGIEKNPYAHELALQNLRANAYSDTIRVYEGDVAQIVPELDGGFDRIVMPLPVSAADYLVLALGSLRPGGWLHYYDFCEKNNFKGAEAAVTFACTQMGRKLASSTVHACGHVSVRKYRVCVDAVIE